MKILSLSQHGVTGSQIFVDTSDPPKNITALGDVFWDDSQYIHPPNAIRFDGNGDLLKILDSDDFVLGSVYSVLFFVKRAAFSRQMIFGQSVSSDNGFNGIRSEFHDNSWNVNINNTIWSTGCIVADTNWHHLALCSDGTSMYAFLDGVLKGTRSSLTVGNSPADFVIGEQTAAPSFPLFFSGWIWKFELYKNQCLHTVDFVPDPTPAKEFLEMYTSLRIAVVAEAFQNLPVVLSAKAEAWRGFHIRRSLAAEKNYEIYVDVSARLEQAVHISVISLAAFEQFRDLSVIGSVGTFEQFRELSVEARDLLIFEAYQGLAVLGQVDNNAFQQSVRLIIDGSSVEFTSFAEQVGAFFRQFDVQVNLNTDTFPQKHVVFISSLRRYAPAQLEFMTTLRLSSGSITVVNRVIYLMYDGVQDESRAPGQETATLRLVSPTAGLCWLKDRKGALPITRNWPKGTLASVVLQDIFAGSGLSYDLRIDDFPIGQLDVRGEFPNQIWPKIFTQELIYTDDDGETLIIAPRLPFPAQNIKDTAALRQALAAAPMNHDLDVSEYMIESTTVDRGGLIEYNAIRVANYRDADAVVQLAPPEIGEADSSGLTAVYGWPVPFRAVWLRGCHLPHDGYELRAEGVEETLELEETISFDNGLARTQRPIFGLLNVDWVGNVSLGTITPAEEGILTAEVSGKSVAVVRYSTRRYKFLYRDVEGDHKMSLWLTDEEAG